MVEKDKDVSQQINMLYEEVHKRIIGNRDVVQQILISIFCGGNILMEGVPGMGKTLLGKTIAETLDCMFRRIQGTPDLTASDIMGDIVYNKETGERTFKKGPIFTHLLLLDEINRTMPKTQSALLESMEEHTVTVGGVSYPLPDPFIAIATENPIEMEGTFPLPEAQKDRFMFKVIMQYPTREEEIEIIKSKVYDVKVNKIFNPPEIMIIRNEVKENVYVSDAILDYVVRIVEATRERREVQTGASPRASIIFTEAAKARAFLSGRDHVRVDDVKSLAFPALRHRIVLNPDSRDFGVTPDDMIAKVLERVEAPSD